MCNVSLTYIILMAYSLSLLQFPLVIATGRNRKLRAGYLNDTVVQTGQPGDIPPLLRDKSGDLPRISRWAILKDINVWGIMVGICMLDGPFLLVRLYLMIHFNIVSYSMVFFTSKNVLVLLLQLYRLYVIIFEQNVAIQKRQAMQRKISMNLRSKSVTQSTSLNQSFYDLQQAQLSSMETFDLIYPNDIELKD